MEKWHPLNERGCYTSKIKLHKVWHPEKEKVYEYIHDEPIQDFIEKFDTWYDCSQHPIDKPDEITLTFKKPWAGI